MYCSSCGAYNQDDSRYCGNCGKRIGDEEVDESSPPPQTYSPPGHRVVPNIPNYLVQAILVTIFCCLPTGIVAIVFAAQVSGKLQAGDIDGARRASNNAKTWAWVSFGLGLGIMFLYFILALAGLAAA